MTESHYLYFWPMEVNKGLWEHISLNVWDPDKNCHRYISHWRAQDTFVTRQTEKRDQQSLLDDINGEGGRMPEILQIPFDFLDPAKVNEWLDIETEDSQKPYNLKNWNCAIVVCKALQIGLRARSLQHEVEQIFLGTRTIPVTPEDVFTWVQNNVKKYKNVKQQRPLSVSASAPLYPCAPLKPTANFTGRSTHLLNICIALKYPETTLVVTTGTGGVGKTELARKVAKKLSNFFWGRVFWMDSETPESLQKSLLDLSTHLKIPHGFKSDTTLIMSMEEMKKLFKAIYSHFSTLNQKSLFIFDNANQFKLSSSPTANESVFTISDFLPNSFPPTTFSPCPAILITSKSSDWAESEDFQVIKLQNFKLEETLEYFKNSFPEASEEQLEDCQPEIESLHQRFDGYTLAFTLAAGWIRGSGHSRNVKQGLKCYLQLFQRPSNELHKKGSSSSSLHTDYKFGPHEIMELTCAAIERENPLALKLLKQMSFLSSDFLTVQNCVNVNQHLDFELLYSALKTLSKFNVITDFKAERSPSLTKAELSRKVSGDNIKVHRAIQQLVKHSTTRFWDASILFEVCETLLKREQLSNLPHLRSLIHNLREIRDMPLESFELFESLDFLIEIRKFEHYLKRLELKIKSLQLNDTMSSMAISTKVKNKKPPIDAEKVMDNPGFLHESDKLCKINHGELADFVLLKMMDNFNSQKAGEVSLDILEHLGSLGIWPQEHIDRALAWLKQVHGNPWNIFKSAELSESQSKLPDDLFVCHFKLRVSLLCLKNPATTAEQRKELEMFKLKLQLKCRSCFYTDENAQNWFNILQHQKTLRGLPFSLTDEDKLTIMDQGIQAAVETSALDDHRKYSLFLNILQENIKTVDDSGSNKIALRLLSYMLLPFMISWINSSMKMKRFAEIFLRLVPYSQSCSSWDVDKLMLGLERGTNSVEEGLNRVRFLCGFVMAISILSGPKSEELVRQIDSYFKRLYDIFKSVTCKGILINIGAEEQEILKGFLPYLNSFVEQNQNSRNENAKKLANEVQWLILILRSTD